MQLQTIKDNVYAVLARDWDRRLFDELIPLPEGTSYNAYVVRGSEKTALVDTVDPVMQHGFFAALDTLDTQLDYIIANHAEQDHSGSIPAVLRHYPEAQVVCTPKCKPMLMDHLMVSDQQIITVADGDTLSLGNKTLTFLHAPWVHWPETMLTYLEEDSVLFSCDFFGSHIATSAVYAHDTAHIFESAKRYYAEIMMPFRMQINKHLDRLADVSIDLIAPSHGPLHDRPTSIMDAYRAWASDEVENEVVLLYVSMHGSVDAMVDYLIDALLDRGIVVKPFNLTRADVGELAMALVDAATIVVGSSTVLGGPHPAVASAVFLANALRPKTRYAAIIGSYGWGGRMVDRLAELMPNLKVEVLDPVISKGYPSGEDFSALDALADTILKKHAHIVNKIGGEQI
jgi:flavorubredoxin